MPQISEAPKLAMQETKGVPLEEARKLNLSFANCQLVSLLKAAFESQRLQKASLMIGLFELIFF